VDTVLLIKALILGVVEGLTEFLPVSSTGHLILAGSLLDFTDEKAKLFTLVIQVGAIAAICFEYRRKIGQVLRGLLHRDAAAIRFTVNLAVAFLPLAVLGLAFNKIIKAHLFSPVPVALAFIVGALIIVWAEKRQHVVRIDNVDDLSVIDALKLGIAQAFALIPGTSRSGATIIGGLLFGLSRQAATEFSFFLAIPTLTIASAYDLYKHRELLDLHDDIGLFGVGTLAAFISAWLAVKGLLRYISHHNFIIFAWYRIIFGLIVLLTAHYGWVQWHAD
jgi:undecaprenyl-diphosphatase